MPLVPTSYQAPAYLFNGHVQTMYPYLVRNVKVNYERERIELADGDFLDLDWLKRGSKNLMILCHGLEGSSESQYMQGMAKAIHERGFDVLAINFRSCSGEMNRKLKMYHHGDISDLTTVLNRVVSELRFERIFLCGFSLGGNVILKYLGTLGSSVPPTVLGGVAISVPCDLASSSVALDRWDNYLYTRRFRRSLLKKFKLKEERFPGTLDLSIYHQIGKWSDFDNTYTTKLTPFATAEEYYEQGSAKNFIHGIKVPTLILNAQNDPFLTQKSYPTTLCRGHKFVHLEMPTTGGHVGFWHTPQKLAYTESRTLDFFAEKTTSRIC